MRKQLLLSFLKKNGFDKVEIKPIKSDASSRKYFRINNNKPLIIMDAPPEYENIKLFIKLSKVLNKIGLSAPKIFYSDIKNGFALIEDFGDSTYKNILDRQFNEEKLYESKL